MVTFIDKCTRCSRLLALTYDDGPESGSKVVVLPTWELNEEWLKHQWQCEHCGAVLQISFVAIAGLTEAAPTETGKFG